MQNIYWGFSKLFLAKVFDCKNELVIEDLVSKIELFPGWLQFLMTIWMIVFTLPLSIISYLGINFSKVICVLPGGNSINRVFLVLGFASTNYVK